MKNHIRFTNTGKREPAGFRVFQFTAYKDGKEVGRLSGRSGQAAWQLLRGYNDPRSTPGCGEPLPEGEYNLGLPEREAGGPGAQGWAAGLNGRWMPLTPRQTLVGDRGDFGCHPDGAAPGSLGCTVTYSNESWEEVVRWRTELGLSLFVVDYGLGLVEPLKDAPPPEEPRAKVLDEHGTEIGGALLINGVAYPDMKTLAALCEVKLRWDGAAKTITVKQ